MDGATEPGWLRRMLVEAFTLHPPDGTRNIADLFDALAGMLRRPDSEDWARTIAHAGHLAAENPQRYTSLARTMHLLFTVSQWPEADRLRAAAEFEDAAGFLRGG